MNLKVSYLVAGFLAINLLVTMALFFLQGFGMVNFPELLLNRMATAVLITIAVLVFFALKIV